MRNLINGFGTPLALHRRVTDSPSVTWTNPKNTKLKSLQRKTSKKGDIKQHGLEPVLGHPLMVVSATLAAQAPESVTLDSYNQRSSKINCSRPTNPTSRDYFIFILEPVVCGWPPVQHPSSQPKQICEYTDSNHAWTKPGTNNWNYFGRF